MFLFRLSHLRPCHVLCLYFVLRPTIKGPAACRGPIPFQLQQAPRDRRLDPVSSGSSPSVLNPTCCTCPLGQSNHSKAEILCDSVSGKKKPHVFFVRSCCVLRFFCVYQVAKLIWPSRSTVSGVGEGNECCFFVFVYLVGVRATSTAWSAKRWPILFCARPPTALGVSYETTICLPGSKYLRVDVCRHHNV